MRVISYFIRVIQKIWSIELVNTKLAKLNQLQTDDL